MKFKFCIPFLILGIFLSGCSAGPEPEPDTTIIAATTYPVYLLAQEVTRGAEGVEVRLVVDQELSCVHNYTLTMQDMQVVEDADLILISGAGLEDFLSDVLAGKTTVDCSEGVPLLEGACSHGEHEHEESSSHHHHHDVDPHIWMSPENAAIMTENIGAALAESDPEQGQLYTENASSAAAQLRAFGSEMRQRLEILPCREIITFHDGFGYFAQSMGLTVLMAVEEEEGGEAPARTLATVIELVKEHRLPGIFTEINGSDSAAQTIARECGIQTAPLSMCMSGNGGGIAAYQAVIEANVMTILEVYG